MREDLREGLRESRRESVREGVRKGPRGEKMTAREGVDVGAGARMGEVECRRL